MILTLYFNNAKIISSNKVECNCSMSLKASETSVMPFRLKNGIIYGGRQVQNFKFNLKCKSREENNVPYDGKQWGDTTVSGGGRQNLYGGHKSA